MTTADDADALTAELHRVADPARAPGQQAYLKSARTHLGLTVGQVRDAVVRHVRELAGDASAGARLLTPDHAFALAESLWPVASPPPHELQTFDHCLAGVEVLTLHAGLLTPPDLPRLEPFLRDAGTWALVDPLATQVVGAIAVGHPGRELDRTLDAWSLDQDFWVRRTCLLAELRPLAAGRPFDRFARHADLMVDEREFFVRKAIGWVLRDVARRRPDEVIAYALPRAARLSAVTWRELIRHLPTEDVERLEDARRQAPAS